MTNYGGDSYTYDAENQRLRKTENGTKKYYLAHGLQVYAEFTTDTAPDAEYVHGLGRKLAKYSPGAGYRFFYTDHLGSTRRLERDESSANMRVDYFPYGEVLTQAGTDETPYTFTGKELDAATGLQYFGALYYDPRIGRWLVVDPLAGKYPWLSPYNYSLGNPINNFDPDGRSVWTKLAKAVFKVGKKVAKEGVGSLKKGATYADAFSEIIDDVKTVTVPSASGLAKAGAVLSLASELLPVSAGDAMDVVKFAKGTKAAKKAGVAKGGGRNLPFKDAERLTEVNKTLDRIESKGLSLIRKMESFSKIERAFARRELSRIYS